MMRKLILLLLLAVPLRAEDAGAPMLFIERIEVRNHKRVSPDVVIAESRLREGREYSEADLRDAATRLGRLPFLLSVDFALEKGTERGRHVLVLTVQETKPFFFLIDAIPYYENDPYVHVYDDRSEENLALGFRWFVGRRGAAHVGFSGMGGDHEFTREYASLSVGYTQYDLFGTRAFATLNLKKPLEGYGEGLVSPQVVVGVPVSANQTIALEYDESRFGGETRTIFGENFEQRHGERLLTARWSYNTTNEPFFPTRGTLLHVTPLYGWTDGARIFTTIAEPDGATVIAGAYHQRILGVRAGATHYWERSDRDSIHGDLRGEWARNEQRSGVAGQSFTHTARVLSVGAGWSRSLWSREQRAGGGDSRVEVTGRLAYPSREDETPWYYADRGTRQIAAAWLRRTSWGTLRVGAGYAW